MAIVIAHRVMWQMFIAGGLKYLVPMRADNQWIFTDSHTQITAQILAGMTLFFGLAIKNW